jgi:nucleotide-binding universal stress UspA family protein
VLLAYDGSDHARAAIAEAAGQLGTGRPAVVLTVWRDYDHYTPVIVPADPVPPGLAEVAERDAQKLAGEGAEMARAVGFDATPMTESGDPVWRRIIDVADALDASLLVLGSHGRTGLRRVLMGSVAHATASHTDRDVLIVHIPESHGDGESGHLTLAPQSAQELS